MSHFLWIEMKKIKGAIWVFSSSTDIPAALTWQPLTRSSGSSRTGLNTCQTPTMGCRSTAEISAIWGEFLVKWATLGRWTVCSQTWDIISTLEAIVWFFFFSFFFYPALHATHFLFKDSQDVLYWCFYMISSLLRCIKNWFAVFHILLNILLTSGLQSQGSERMVHLCVYVRDSAH